METKPKETKTKLPALFVPLLALPLLALQEDPPDAAQPLKQVRPVPSLDADACRKALRSEDHQVREAEYDRLIHAALRDPDLRGLVRSWADEPGDLGWTARLALREIALREELQGGNEGLLGRSDDFPFAMRSPFGRSPWPDQRMFQDLEDELKQLFEQGPFQQIQPGQPGQRGVFGEHKSFRMESTPDGVRVEVREETEDGEDVKTYEADSLEDLYEQHPELRDVMQGGLGGTGRFDFGRDLGGIFDRLRGPLGRSRYGPNSTDRLGILMREPGSWSASVEGIEPGIGLYVERVFPGTLADVLGIQPGDIVISLNGRDLHGGADVRATLEARDPTDEVKATVVDTSGKRRELSWKPPSRKTSGSLR